MKTLKSAKIGETVTVVKLHGEGAVKRPIEVTVRGYELSIRKADADMIEIA